MYKKKYSEIRQTFAMLKLTLRCSERPHANFDKQPHNDFNSNDDLP